MSIGVRKASARRMTKVARNMGKVGRQRRIAVSPMRELGEWRCSRSMSRGWWNENRSNGWRSVTFSSIRFNISSAWRFERLFHIKKIGIWWGQNRYAILFDGLCAHHYMIMKGLQRQRTYQSIGPDLQSGRREVPVMNFLAYDLLIYARCWKQVTVANGIFFA
jgi:hypothetical protein